MQEKEIASFRKKMNKAMINGIVFGVADESFGRIAFKRPLAEILSQPSGVTAIRNTIINKVILELTGGAKILNNNIPEKIFVEARLKQNQYLKPGQSDQSRERKPREGGEDENKSHTIKR